MWQIQVEIGRDADNWRTWPSLKATASRIWSMNGGMADFAAQDGLMQQESQQRDDQEQHRLDAKDLGAAKPSAIAAPRF